MHGFQPGDVIALRDVWRGRVWAARPVVVVRDTLELIALWTAPGSTWKQPHDHAGQPLRVPCDDWVLRDRLWTGGGALRLISPGAAHAVLALWTEGHRALDFWYINLQQPLRRTPLGFDTLDQVLDIVVSPDLSAAEWKDEDELETAQAMGTFSLEEVRRIRAEGERALRKLLARRPPFSEGWERWVPDPSWPVPSLPNGWDVV